MAEATRIDLSDVHDPTIIVLWKRIFSLVEQDSSKVFPLSKDKGDALVRGMSVCKTFKAELAPMVKRINISKGWRGARAQKTLNYIAETFKNLEQLDISPEYDDHTPEVDFRHLKFPELRRLTLRCAPIGTLNFTTANTPKLEALTLEHSRCLAAFDLDLPELKTIMMDFVEVNDEMGFGPSLSRCPKLERVLCYKLWGLGGTVHELHLPNCETLNFYRSDDLTGLKVWAPKLQSLELRACYGLECVRIMPDPEGTQQMTPLQVNLIHANIDRVSKQHLKNHPRVKAPGGKLMTKERHDELTMMFAEYGDDDEESSEDDSDGDDAGLEAFLGGLNPVMGGFNPIMQMMNMMMQGANPQMLQMMLQAEMLAGAEDEEVQDEDEDVEEVHDAGDDQPMEEEEDQEED